MRLGVIESMLIVGGVVATNALAQVPPIVDVTHEPRHHLEMTNDCVRVFDVVVAPHTTTLVHRHVDDYLFVTLVGGDADVTNVRWGDAPSPLILHAGDVNFAAGLFAHSAAVNSDGPFHNTTIALRHTL